MARKKKSRLKEPSTWAGAASILAGAAQLPIPGAQPWLVGLAAISGAVAMAMREGEKPDKSEAEQDK